MATFVGIGFGPIQAGLFLYEAAQSGNFDRLIASEIVPEVVEAVNLEHGYIVNIARENVIEQAHIAPVTLHNPSLVGEFDALADAIAEASAIATALPSVAAYMSTGAGSPVHLLAEGLIRKRRTNGPPAVIYAGENHNHAAELLREAVAMQLPETTRGEILGRSSFVNTVIGKMSGYADPRTSKQALAYIAPGLERAFLVEAFSDILISQIHFGDPNAERAFLPGITRFAQKQDLFPFEEAKLYCHNAMHAFAAYLGKIAGCTSMAQLRHVPGMLSLVRAAAVEEPGVALVRKYAGVDPLFTEEGMAAYIDDLVARMVNPLLDDAIERVARDPARKLGWGDRLIGAMRLAIQHGIAPHRFALGAAAALADLASAEGERTGAFPWGRLPQLWQRPSVDDTNVQQIERLIAEAWTHLEAFRDASSDTPVAPANGVVEPITGASASAIADPVDSTTVDKEIEVSAHAIRNSAANDVAGKWGEETAVKYRRKEK